MKIEGKQSWSDKHTCARQAKPIRASPKVPAFPFPRSCLVSVVIRSIIYLKKLKAACSLNKKVGEINTFEQ